MKAKKKLYAVLMASVMAVSTIPGTAFAAETTEHECTYVKSSVLKAGSCTETGIWKETCECGKYKYVSGYEHEFEENTIVEETCTEPAKVGTVCALCGETDSEMTVVEESEALGHELVADTENENYVEATCGEGGVDVLKCSRCDYTEETETEALGHEWGNEVPVEAGCENAAGVQKTCEKCGKEDFEAFTEETGLAKPALGHVYEAVVTEPTCSAGGYTTYTCKVCGDEYTAEETEAVADAHVSVLVKTLKEAGCKTTGIGSYACEICGKSFGYKVIPAGNHTEPEDGVVVEEATCAEDGSKTYTCAVCGEEQEEVLPATGEHSFEEGIKEATCEAPAMVGEICTVCGTTNGEMDVVEGSEALGHELVTDTENENYVAATCEEGGVDVLKCSRCDHTEEVEVEALGHEWGNEVPVEAGCENAAGVQKICERCGEEDFEAFTEETGLAKPALGHAYEAVVTEATCADGGYTTYTCKVCGDEYTADETEVVADAHVSVLVKTLKEAGCKTTGIGSYGCEICGKSLGYKVIAAGNHIVLEDSVVVEEATCAEDGSKTYTCAVCGEEQVEVLPATGEHSFEEGIKEATCEAPAMAGEICTVCGTQNGEMDVVEGSEALGHELVTDTENENYVAATCEEGGVDVLKCSRCDYTEETETEALGHKWGNVVVVEAGCENAAGVQETCERCGKEKFEAFTEETGLAKPALSHVYEAVVTEPTCSAGGYTTYTCKVCGDEYTAEETEAVADAHVSVLVKTLKEAGCKTTGIGSYGCEICGKSLGYKVIPAGNHTVLEDSVVVEEATCAEDGSKTYTCAVCGEEQEEVLPATGEHSFEEDIKEATCEAPTMVGEICTVCGTTNGEMDVVEGSKALGHDMELAEENENNVEATCEEGGVAILKCSRCDHTEEVEIEALGHEWGNEVPVEAGCENAAGVQKICERCGEEDFEAFTEETGLAKPALGHAYEAVVTEPTCSTDGYTTHTCNNCGDEYTDNETEAVEGAHVASDNPVVIREATCTTSGIIRKVCAHCGVSMGYASYKAAHTWGNDELNSEGTAVIRKCEVCGTVEVVQAFDGYECTKHVEKLIPAVEASCTETGLTAGTTCSVCGEVVVPQTEIPAAGHSEEILPAVAPTETETGLTEGKKCSVCGEVLVAQEEIPATGTVECVHENVVTDLMVEASCTETGLTEGSHCGDCGEVLVAQEEVPAAGHKEEAVAGKEATCTEAGLTEGTSCSACGEVLVAQEEVPAAGHKEEAVAGKEATCTEAGLTEGTVCSTCGEVVVAQTEVPAAGHTETTVPGKEATCTETGLTEGTVCSICGEVVVAQTEIPTARHAFGSVQMDEEGNPYRACTVCGFSQATN